LESVPSRGRGHGESDGTLKIAGISFRIGPSAICLRYRSGRRNRGSRATGHRPFLDAWKVNTG